MTVDLIFWVTALLGTGLLLISFVVGEIFDGIGGFLHGALEGLAESLNFDIGGAPDVDAGDVVGGPHALNGPTIFAFTTLFGWGGLLARYFGLGSLASTGVGLVSGLAAATLIYAFYRLLYNQQSDSSYQISDLVGQIGECTTNIDPSSLGQVHVLYRGSSRYMTARRIAEAEAAAANIRVTAEANSASIRLTAEAEAQASRVKGEGEASAIEATGLAEAQAMTKKADAFLRYNDAARLSLMLEKMPEVAAALASPLGNIGNLTVIGTDGASQVTGTVIKEFAQLNAAFKALTGYSFDDLLSKVTESKAQPEGNGTTLPAEKS